MSTDEAPTPSEFVQYILDSADTLGSHHLDPHIRPIWASCPFCTIDFDIIGHLEDRDSDALFIANKLKFGKKQRANVMKQRHKGATLNIPENKTESFFAGMDEDLKLKLYEYCARDYEMFYS